MKVPQFGKWITLGQLFMDFYANLFSTQDPTIPIKIGELFPSVIFEEYNDFIMSILFLQK